MKGKNATGDAPIVQENPEQGMNTFGNLHTTIRRNTLAGVAVMIATLLLLATFGTGYAQSAQPAAPLGSVSLEAPAEVKVGEVVTLRLRVQNAAAIGGFEAYVAFDRNAAEFAGFIPAPAPAGQSRSQLVVAEATGGALVGAYTCATANCLQQRQPQASAAAAPDLFAEIEILPLVSGRLHLHLAHFKAVDSAGQPLAVDLPQSTVVVQVGDGADEYAATAAAWNWLAATPDATVAGIAAVDLTQDGQIGHNDLMEVVLGWMLAREAGSPCTGSTPSADVNGDGCVDIVDVQTAAALAQGAQATAASVVQATTIYTVNSTLDEFDSNVNDGVCRSASNVCTLRAAIQQANAQEGSNLINFAIPGEGVQTIQLGDRLPTLFDTTGGTTIDGYSQPGAAPNTDPVISNAKIMIEIRGNGSEAFDAISISSSNNRVQGLALFNLRRSFRIFGSGAVGNVIAGNFIGTDASGDFFAQSVSQGQAHGIHVELGALSNQIGGVTPAERNVISGNARHGVGFWHVGTDENVVYNNIVGLSPDGTRRLPNRQQGVDMNYGASFNLIGGVEPGQRNIISGNGENGAEITHGVETTKNVIRGNYIGTDVTGEDAPAHTSNGGHGVNLHDRVRDNLIIENVIGNNRAGGIQIDNLGACCIRDNKVESNWIGVSPSGVSIANGVFGVRIQAPQTRIGPGNHIAYNPVGIQIEGDESLGNTITQNSIYSNSGLGIDIAPIAQINLNDADDSDSGPNTMLNYPMLVSLSRQQVSGTACTNCTVEIFITDGKDLGFGEGMTFVGSAVADDAGNFTATVTNVNYGDFLTATATDIQGNTSEFSRNALVPNPQNNAPVAVDDTAITAQGTVVLIDVLGNDSDPEGDTLTVVDLGSVANGDVATDGAFVTYTPTAEFLGTEVFTYTASDAIGGSSVATVTVTVEEGNASAPGVTISPTVISLTLGGPPVSYVIALKSAPEAPVTITLVPEAPLVADPMQLVFTADNFDTPQSVTLSIDAEAATVANVVQTSTVRHSVSSEDSNYRNVGAPTLTVEIVEQISQEIFLPIIER